MKRLATTTVLALAFTLVLASVAFAAASPQAIYDDYAANGTFKGVYTAGELQAYLNDATVHQYGSPTVVANLDNLASQVLAAMKTGKTFEDALKQALQGHDKFPWTGMEIALILAGGALLIGSGFLLRRRVR